MHSKKKEGSDGDEYPGKVLRALGSWNFVSLSYNTAVGSYSAPSTKKMPHIPTPPILNILPLPHALRPARALAHRGAYDDGPLGDPARRPRHPRRPRRGDSERRGQGPVSSGIQPICLRAARNEAPRAEAAAEEARDARPGVRRPAIGDELMQESIEQLKLQGLIADRGSFQASAARAAGRSHRGHCR